MTARQPLIEHPFVPCNYGPLLGDCDQDRCHKYACWEPRSAHRPAPAEPTEAGCTCGVTWPCVLHGGPPEPGAEPEPQSVPGTWGQDQPCRKCGKYHAEAETACPQSVRRIGGMAREEWLKYLDSRWVTSMDRFKEVLDAAFREGEK